MEGIFFKSPLADAPLVREAGKFEGEKTISFHVHPETEIIYVTKGKCSVETAYHSMSGEVGSLFVIPPGIRHNQINHTLSGTLFCVFHSNCTPPRLPEVFLLGRDYWLEQWLGEIVQLNQLNHPLLSNGLLVSVLLRIQQLGKERPADSRIPQPMIRARQYIEDHYTASITLEEIALHSRISSSYLKILFKQYFHTSPIQYQQQLRMRRAEIMLKSPYFRIEEISYECGYEDPSYF